MKFFRTPALLPWLYPSLTWKVNTTDKHLFLTFDDGPVPGPTEFVLDLLSKEQIKATFFCIGNNIEQNPEIFQRILTEGHAVGNHTYDHVNGWEVSTEAYAEEVSRCANLLPQRPQNQRPLFRPPYGKITPGKINSMKEYAIVMWDVLTYDFVTNVTPEQCLTGALKAVRPGSIIVFHDSVKASPNMMFALPRFIDECRQRGYEFRSLGEYRS